MRESVQTPATGSVIFPNKSIHTSRNEQSEKHQRERRSYGPLLGIETLPNERKLSTTCYSRPNSNCPPVVRHRPSSFPATTPISPPTLVSLSSISCSNRSHRSAISSSRVSISSLMPLNLFSRSPRKSSIASASFVVASVESSEFAAAVAVVEESIVEGA
jgi:hypothetical protein